MNEKALTVKIDVVVKNRKRKATFAVRELRRQIAKHFRSNNYVIGNDLNNYFWKEGKKNAPSKVDIVGIEKNNKLYIFLKDSDAYKEFKKKNETKKKETKKKEVKKEAEEKKETKKEAKSDKK